MEKIKITIAGAGVIGLAIALELSKDYDDIFVIEKNSSFGQETSSRNSEVIHSGIYYPKDSLKTKTCIEGRRMLYDFCSKYGIGCKKSGKLIVAINKNEIEDLEKLFRHGMENGVEGLQFLEKDKIKEIEPMVESEAAIYSPCTGILDSHGLMKNFVSQFTSRKGQVAYNTEVTGIDKTIGGYEVTVGGKNESCFNFFTRIFINATGLNSDKISAMAGLNKEEYRIKYCKGDYFRVHQGKRPKFLQRLVYPVPKNDRGGLGIHATLDLAGALRLGPDDEYVEKIDYAIDTSKKNIFYESVRSFLSFVQLKDLNPDTSGIRPKLQGPGEGFRDFIIRDESDNGFPGLINLIGIESPGLTGSLSIAGMVKAMVSDAFR